MTHPATLADLRNSPWGEAPLRHRSVREEIRTNLLAHLAKGGPLFPGVVGYDDTVVPQIVNALLARQDFILLGTRGQAKTRLLRALVHFLDDAIPVVAGSEVHDDPFAPISRWARDLIAEQDGATPIAWLPRERRFVEKLATPDVTVADLIGDVDPIKAARGGLLLGDELTIHYGLLPRANRCIFAINELPDLAAKIQVALFNVLQEGDVQIKGYPVRMPLDVMLAFTANPEDYTARGKIITPLKDRIGSEIRTHAPRSVADGMAITAQEAWLGDGDASRARVPELVAEVVERIAFEAREDQRVDRRAGVSQRLTIALLEVVASNAERRALASGEPPVVRLADVYAGLPAITGKLELEYEGELQGADAVARELIRRAAAAVFETRAPDAEVDEIVQWFDQGNAIKVGAEERTEVCHRGFDLVPGLTDLVIFHRLARKDDPVGIVVACELVLEALVARQRIARNDEYGFQKARPRRREP